MLSEGHDHAELRAIALALLKMLRTPEFANKDGSMPDIEIFSDSQSAVHTLRKPIKWESDDPINWAMKAAIKLKEIALYSHLQLYWIPGHRTISGNVLADTMANEAADIAETLDDDEHPAREYAIAEAWKQASKSYKRGIIAQKVGAPFDRKRGKELRCMTLKLTVVQMTRRLHWLGGYAFSRITPPTKCPACLEPSPPAKKNSLEAHILFERAATLRQREHLNIVPNEDDQPGWILARPNLDKFVLQIEPLKQAGRAESKLIRERSNQEEEEEMFEFENLASKGGIAGRDISKEVDVTMEDDIAEEAAIVLAAVASMAEEEDKDDDSDDDDDDDELVIL